MLAFAKLHSFASSGEITITGGPIELAIEKLCRLAVAAIEQFAYRRSSPKPGKSPLECDCVVGLGGLELPHNHIGRWCRR